MPFPVFPQNHNLVTVTLPRTPFTDTAALASASPARLSRTVTAYDGLERVTQKVQVAASPAKKDLITAYEYDIAGRREKEYLPYTRTSGSKDHIAGDPLSELRTFYRDPPPGITPTSFPYARKVFDASPLNRILQQGSPGTPWQPQRGHAVTFSNTVNLRPVPRWQADSKGECAVAGTYAPGSLRVKESRDEDGRLSRTYTDKRGRTILRETLLDTLPVQTFYVYDDRDRLRLVIPPMAAAAGTADERYLFRYSYDDRSRMITKKIPGAEPVEMVYDNMNRLIMSRDGNLRRDARWHYTLYDAFGRITQQGLCRSDKTREALQRILDGKQGPLNDTASLPASRFMPQQYIFYDDYAFLSDTALAFHAEDLAGENPRDYPLPFEPWERADRNRNRQTGSRVRIPATGAWLTSVTYYDDPGRVIQTVRQNHLGGTDRVSNLYDFSGNILKSITTHSTAHGTTHTLIRRYDYDHDGRLLRTFFRLDTLPEVILSENSYDELGRVKEKRLHGTGGGSFAQSIGYHYNIRGWLTAINDPGSLGEALFAEELHYEDPAGYDADSLFSGNISVIRWRTPSLGGSAAYAFGYDGLGRLVQASWHRPENAAAAEDYSVPLIAYDLNGNIDTLVRYGARDSAQWDAIDALKYSYDGNRLIAVDDAAGEGTEHHDFSDRGAKYDPSATGRQALPEYLYDANGNMVADANKGIVRIRYDRNNLPREILFDNDRMIRYLYDANGTKLRKEVYGDKGHLISVTDYDGSFVYQDGEPAYLLTGEGRLVYDEEQGWQWEYYLKDHLGNIRIVFHPDSAGHPQIVQETHYYPFGMVLSSLSSTTPDSPNPNKYLYNTKELQTAHHLNWYDYGARFYNTHLANFITIDPKAEKYSFQSPYSYALNNPIKYIDLNGEGVPPLGDVFYERERIRRSGDTKALEGFEEGMKKSFKGTGKVLRYAGNTALIIFGGPVGITLGIPSLGLQIGKDGSKLMGGNKERINKTANTFTGVLLQTTVKIAGGDSEKAGAIGDLTESIFTSGTLLKPATNAKEKAEKCIIMTNLVESINNSIMKKKDDDTLKNQNEDNDN